MTLVNATIFIADKQRNAMMRAFDLCPNYKVFVTEKENVTFRTSTRISKKYFLNIIEKSKADDKCWIPAIQHGGKLYVSPEIMELSDGNSVAFVRENAA
jgi:hypothetical protein